MLFNSLPFAIFFTVVFMLYWFVFNRNLKVQNLFVLAASYAFYAWADWRILFLLILSTAITYWLGIAIYKSPDVKGKSRLLNLGLVLSVGALLYFKYTNFFIDTINSVSHTGIKPLNIILPLGISFYTFRILSYLFDIKNGKLQPTTNVVVFASYISFFPCVISGPIDRPKTLIPQLEKPRVFDNALAIDGLRQILWGIFKKVVIADNCAQIANYAFDTPGLHGYLLIAGAFFYTIQIYADFSGYSDMAIGVGKLLGFNVTRNFNYPYFAQNVADFWRRWHMSLTSWLTDYIFTPASISFRDLGTWGGIVGIIITFLVSGLWHGANWTFVLWGFLHGCYFIPLILKGKMNKKKEIPATQTLPTLTEFKNIILTFALVMVTFVLFRSADLHSAFTYYRSMFLIRNTSPGKYPLSLNLMVLAFIAFMLVMEWRTRAKQHPLQNAEAKWPKLIRWGFYFGACLLIMVFTGHAQQFIYFKF